MKKIIVIATGGTIAGSGEDGRTTEYRAGTIDVSDILETIPQINNLAEIEMVPLISVDSNEMNERYWIKLRNTINEQAKRPDVDGIVITHGTDTIEETAYFLNLTIATEKPVVLTGAMRPATATSPDGPFNLFQAIALAANEKAHDCGVMCLFSSTIYSARNIAKTNNHKIDAFGLNEQAALGYMRDADVFITNHPMTKHTLRSKFCNQQFDAFPKVKMATYYAGADTDLSAPIL